MRQAYRNVVMENLGIDLKLLIAQIVNFTVFFMVFQYFIAKPLTKMISNEKKKEKERDRILAELASKEERMTKEEDLFRKSLEKEKDTEMEETKKAALTLKQTMLAEAKQDSAAILSKAREQIEAERTSLQNQIRLKAIDLSIFMIDKALKAYLTEDTKRSLTEHIVKSLGRNVKTYEN